MEQGMHETDTKDIVGPAPRRIAQAFARALELARAHEGATAPNPPVGCVLLDAAGTELAAGAHRRAGTAHAEATAIATARQAGLVEHIHTAIVTLEPCNHHGRTPPCAEALLATPARQIWIACRDPNPKVGGGGMERLMAAGRRVSMLADLPQPDALNLADDAERLIAPFRKYTLTGLPFVTVKQAVSETGSMIPPPGRKTFTAHASLVLAHSLRRRADAILTGSGTVLADDPHFTVRLVADHPEKQRQLVIMDRRRRVSPDYLAAARRRGFSVHLQDDLPAALAMIGASGGMEALVEAGPALADSVLTAGLWDEHVLIEQAGGLGGTDRVTIRRRQTAELHPHTQDSHVFRHH
jgi:diaminohydroxyphosphoribosylaminopyrimidine deaminase/5-amino-6-(5-phosphoribosylamino)uracil reductase